MHNGTRIFTTSDTQAVIDLWEISFPDDPPWNKPADVIRTKLRTQPDLFFVYVHEDTVVGTVLAGFDGVRGWVHKLAVHPEHQGMGFGVALMETAEVALAANGCPKLNLQVRASNTRVIDFYHRLGYSMEERVSMGKAL